MILELLSLRAVAVSALATFAAAQPARTVASPSEAVAVVASGASPAPALKRVVITARDFSYDMVDTLDAGATEFVLRNLGPEFHHAQFVRLEGGHTVKELLALPHDAPPPSWAVLTGGPNTPNPGGESRGIVALRPGRYAVLCLIPSPDGTPHVAKGMAKEFVVRAVRNPAPLPAADITLTLHDYAFAWSKPIRVGKTMLAVTTAPNTQPHEVVIVKLAPGKAMKDVLAFLHEMKGPPPMSMVGGTVGVVAGDSMIVPLDLTAGEYVLLCMLPDAKDGKPHVMHGMAQQFTVR